MDWVPNFNDPRVKRRVASVLQWCDLMLHPERPTQIHHKMLRSIFGGRGNPLTTWLKENLLIRTSEKGDFKAWRFCKAGEDAKSYEYVLNAVKAAELRAQLPSAPQAVKVTVSTLDEHADAIQSGDFTYKVGENSQRLCHPLHTIKREKKARFWAERGYHWNYDIQAAGPTMLSQLAFSHGVPQSGLPMIMEYLADRDAFRQHVADVARIDLHRAKHLINALVNGAALAASRYSKLFSVILKFDRYAVERLRADPKIQLFLADVKQMWSTIGAGLKVPVRSASQKSKVYYPIERLVLDAMRDELRTQGGRFFCEHDGFVSDFEVDIQLLQEKVAQATGIHVKLEVEVTNA